MLASEIAFPDAPSPRLANRDASPSTPRTRLSTTLNCCTWFPCVASNPAVTLMPLRPEEDVTPKVGVWSTWLQKICAADTTLLSAGDGGSFGDFESPDPPTMLIPTNGVSTSLLAIEIPFTLF